MLWEHHFCLFIYSQAIYGNYLSRAKIGVKDHHAGNNLFPVDGYQFRGANVPIIPSLITQRMSLLSNNPLMISASHGEPENTSIDLL